MNPDPTPPAPLRPAAAKAMAGRQGYEGQKGLPARPAGGRGAGPSPTEGVEKPAEQPRPSKALPLLLSVIAVAAVIAGAMYMLFPRPSPLTAAQERLARIESVRLLRKLDLLKSEIIARNRKQSAERLFGTLSVPPEQRERVSLLQKILGTTRP